MNMIVLSTSTHLTRTQRDNLIADVRAQLQDPSITVLVLPPGVTASTIPPASASAMERAANQMAGLVDEQLTEMERNNAPAEALTVAQAQEKADATAYATAVLSRSIMVGLRSTPESMIGLSIPQLARCIQAGKISLDAVRSFLQEQNEQKPRKMASTTRDKEGNPIIVTHVPLEPPQAPPTRHMRDGQQTDESILETEAWRSRINLDGTPTE